MSTKKYKGDSWFPDRILLFCYRFKNRYLRKLIREMLLRSSTVEIYSRSLRELFSKYHKVDVGMYSYGTFRADLPPGTTVGRYSSIARGLLVIGGSHPVRHKSTHPFFYNPDFGYVKDLLIERRSNLTIGNDVYIGLNVILYPAVTSIGDGAVIAAGSVVTKDVPPYAMVGGNPAKLIRFRFHPKTIEKLSSSSPWWNSDIEDLAADRTTFTTFLRPFEGGTAD